MSPTPNITLKKYSSYYIFSSFALAGFTPDIGWVAYVYSSATLGLKFKHTLYKVDNEDFTRYLCCNIRQLVGNCQISSKFLLITPTTPQVILKLFLS